MQRRFQGPVVGNHVDSLAVAWITFAQSLIGADIQIDIRLQILILSGVPRFELQGMSLVVPERRAAEDIAAEHARFGEEDLRPVVQTHIEIHGVCWPIEVTLAKRKLMGFRMLIGREAMWGRFIVDPSRSYLGGEPCMQLEDGEVFIQQRR